MSFNVVISAVVYAQQPVWVFLSLYISMYRQEATTAVDLCAASPLHEFVGVSC